MNITILVATPDGVVEYSLQGVHAQFATKQRWDKFVQDVTLRTPPPDDQFELRVNDFDYIQGSGTSKYPETPIYDQLKAEMHRKAYGG